MPKATYYSTTTRTHISAAEPPLTDVDLARFNMMRPPEGTRLITRRDIIYAWVACGWSFPLDVTKNPIKRLCNLSVAGTTLLWAGKSVATIEYTGVVIHAFGDQALYNIVPIIKDLLAAVGYKQVDALPEHPQKKKTRGNASKRKFDPTRDCLPREELQALGEPPPETELESAQPDEYLADDDPFVTGLAEFADT